MRQLVLAVVALAFTAPVLADDTAATQPAAAPAPTQEQVVAQFKSDLQAKRSDLMAKNLTLTADQAAKFWPMYDAYQKEQNGVIDEQVKAVQAYADHYATLTDADSVAFIGEQLGRDGRMQQLRVKWLAKFQTILPGGLAARAIQIDRRISNVAQVMLSAQLPLVH